MALSLLIELSYLGLCLEGFLFGVYSGIFAVLCRYHASKEETDNKKRNLILYVLCMLYVLSGVVLSLDIARYVLTDHVMSYRFAACGIAVFACCDVIAQSILIWRCWIMWRYNLRFVIIPSTLAFGFLVMWMAQIGSESISPSGLFGETFWGDVLFLTGITASLAVNALATGLIVFRIFKVFLQIKIITTSDEKALDTPGRRKLRSIIFILIESGMALFVIQLTRVVIGVLNTDTNTINGVYGIIVSIHEMLNGITPTIIQVRVAMGSSFHDESSLEEAVGSLQFASVASDNSDPGFGSIPPDEPHNMRIEHDDPIPILEIGNVTQESESHGIQVVDR